jgi:uncharacterized protein YggE
MKWTALLLGLSIIIPTLLRAEPELKGSPTDLAQIINAIPKTVQITGESEVRVPAARAVVNLAVITENKSLQEALRLNGDVRSRINADLQQQGIPAERIQTSRFSSTPKFGLWGDKAKSYRVENTMRISVQDEKEFRGAAKVVDNFAEANYSGVEFEYSDQEASKAKAIAQACDNAESRKKIYEEHVGIKLSPKRFTEGAVVEKEALPPPRKADYDSYSKISSPSVQESMSSFGEIVYTAKVTVEYQVDAR